MKVAKQKRQGSIKLLGMQVFTMDGRQPEAQEFFLFTPYLVQRFHQLVWSVVSFYYSLLHSILEYVCPVWHTGVTVSAI